MRNPRRVSLHVVVLGGVAALVASMLAVLSLPAQADQHPTRSSDQRSAKPLSAAAKKALKQQNAQPGTPKSRRTARAMLALDRAQRALAYDTPAAKRPDATLALNKLLRLRKDLPRSQRKLARSLTDRPNKPMDAGDSNIKVHYDPAELTTYSINDALSTLTYVANTYAAAGYRRPPSDGKRGGDSRLDVYLDQLGTGLYGYCISDQVKVKSPGNYGAWSYCVLDNDFANFASNTPLQNLQVTAAHEYFHAVQFGYDVREDKWLLEATAVWAEDQLFDDINDNRQYLYDSPITRPKRSIDNNEVLGYYGVWTFIRYLTEQYPQAVGTLPELVLRTFQYADSTRGRKRNLYSTEALDKALRKVAGTTLADAFARYSAANLNTHLFYSEGAEGEGYPNKPVAGEAALGPGGDTRFRTRLNHLASTSYRLTPSGTAAGTTMQLRFQLGKKFTRGRAAVVSYGPAGQLLGFDVIKPNKRGVAKTRVDFSSTSVSAVEVTLVNGSTRYRKCFSGDTVYSCGGGIPIDQKLPKTVRAKVS
jgi:hypothetical protein